MKESQKYVATIGLEIHAELKTASKMFCSCKNDPDEEKPNVNVCPICLGHPGTLPVLNKEAIKHVLKIGHAIGGTIADFTEWDRKNYFYPDIPKGYQISQYKYPLISGGKLNNVDLTRIHLEEDTAQSTHDLHEKSLINFNRAGVPLMELVTEPVIHDAETAVAFAKELQLLLRYTGAGEANMEKGEMRVEANISVSADGNLGTKTEVKNLNSFKVVEKAIQYEIARQTKLLEKGEKVVQETRGWDESTQKTYSQRLKESSHDYRYFPDPDIPKMKISEAGEFTTTSLLASIDLPWVKREQFKNLDLTDKETAVFVDNPKIGKYFESVIYDKPNIPPYNRIPGITKLAVNYILTDYLGLLKQDNLDLEKNINKIDPIDFRSLLKITADKKINSRGTKDILALLYKGDTNPEKLAETHGLIQKNDEGELKKIVEEMVKANPNVVEDYKSGKQAALMFFVGQGMKATKGSANPEVLKKIILEVIG